MNRLEKACMNSALRTCFQERVEAPLLERLGGRVEGQRVLEVGCGCGSGTGIILRRFGAARVDAFDLDPDMVAKARRRLSSYPPGRIQLSVGDATAMEAEDSSYDAVFDFAILHHIPRWQKALEEIFRVLRPGGKFYYEEVTAQWIQRWPYRSLFLHPQANRFSGSEFVSELERQGFTAGARFVERRGGDFIFGVSGKAATSQATD